MTNRLLLALALLASGTVLHAQSSVSPYALFGAGAADSGVHGWNAGMAGLGTGIRADNMLNPSNPASLSSLQRKSFIMDIAVSGSGSLFSGRGMRTVSGTGNLDRVCLGFRLGGRVAAGVGLVPFSSVEYRIQKSAFGEGTGETFNTVYSGSGGLHKVYLSLAVDITDNLSVGVNGSVVMGTVTSTEYSEYWTETTESGCNITPYMDFGLQYSKPLGNGGTVTAGLKYGYRQKLSLYNTYTLTDNMDTTSVSDKVLPGTVQYIPETFGAGLSYSTANLTVGVDYRRQEWSSCSTDSDVISYKDMDKLIFGLSYTPDPYSVRSYWKRIKYLFGASVDNSYLTVGGISAKGWSLTFGMVLPVRLSTRFYWSAGFSRSGFPTENRNTVMENCLRLTAGISFGESWFVRKKFE